MIQFKPHRIDHANFNMPIISDREIDDFAQAILADYKPQLLKEPGTINFQHFLESYLGASIEYHDIYNDDPTRPILAMAVYGEGEIKVFDRANQRISHIPVSKRTVVIDNSVMERGKEGLALFSGLHEAGHILLHWDVYLRMIDAAVEYGDETDPVIFCRRQNIEAPAGGKKERTAEDWRERQADCFASALAMPNVTFKAFVHRFMRDNGYYRSFITLGKDNDLDMLAKEILPEAISDIYGVSRRAAQIKLSKTGFVNTENSRYSIFYRKQSKTADLIFA